MKPSTKGLLISAAKTLALAIALFIALYAFFDWMSVGQPASAGPCDHLYDDGSPHEVIDACIHENGLEGPCHSFWHNQDWNNYDACLDARFGSP